MAEVNKSGIGKPAADLKQTVESALADYEKKYYYNHIQDESNPYKIEANQKDIKIENRSLDALLTARIENAIFGKRIKLDPKTKQPTYNVKNQIILEDDPTIGLPGAKFKDSKDPTLKELQKLYDDAIAAHKAGNGNVAPKGEDLDAFNRAFLKKPENQKLVEELKIKLLEDNRAKLSLRVSNAKDASTLVVGNTAMNRDIGDRNTLEPARAYFTPVFIGTSDPANTGQANHAAFKTRGFREWYMDLKYDKDKKTIEMGHDVGEQMIIPFKVNDVRDPRGMAMIDRFFVVKAEEQAPPGQFVPYEKLFEMAMTYYDPSPIHKVLGDKEAKKKGDAVMSVMLMQLDDQMKLLDKRGNLLVKQIDPRAPNTFVDLQNPLENFIAKLTNLDDGAKKEGDAGFLKIEDKHDIKNKPLKKVIEDAYNEAEELIKNGMEREKARALILAKPDNLKQLLRKYPEPTKAELDKIIKDQKLKDANPGKTLEELREIADTRSARLVDDLVKKNGLEILNWTFDDEKLDSVEPAKLKLPEMRDVKRQEVIRLLSEQQELKRLNKNLEKMMQQINQHYGPGFAAAPAPQEAMFAASGMMQELRKQNLLLNDQETETASMTANLTGDDILKMREALADFTSTAIDDGKKQPTPAKKAPYLG